MQKPTTITAVFEFPLIVVVENGDIWIKLIAVVDNGDHNGGISTNSNVVVPNSGNWLS